MKKTRWIYLYVDCYNFVISDKELNYTLISTHKSVTAAEKAAEKFNPDAMVHYDKSVYEEAQYSLVGDDYEMLVHDYSEDVK